MFRAKYAAAGFPLLRCRCAVCDKDVDRMEAQENHYDDTIMYKVWCHGDVDNCSIPRYFFEDNDMRNIVDMVAFGTKRISHVQS